MNEPRLIDIPKVPEKLLEIARFQAFVEAHLDEVDIKKPGTRSKTYESDWDQSAVTFTATTIGEYTANFSPQGSDSDEPVYIIDCIVQGEELQAAESRKVIYLPFYNEVYMFDLNGNVLRPEGARLNDYSLSTVDSWLDRVEESLNP